MLINIITPCSRPENLKYLSESINIPRDKYRWIVVFDSCKIPNVNLPNNAEYFLHEQRGSVCGNAQRNYAIDLTSDGYIMFLDDDTILHPNLWQEIKNSTDDLVCWKQCNSDNTHRLNSGELTTNYVDSGSFMVKRSTIANIRWEIGVYSADGIFAEAIAANTTSIFNIDKYISYYNYLR